MVNLKFAIQDLWFLINEKCCNPFESSHEKGSLEWKNDYINYLQSQINYWKPFEDYESFINYYQKYLEMFLENGFVMDD